MPVDTVEPLEAEAPQTTLNANDRCDQCGAQAYAWALLETGELLFCAHHWAQYKEKIESKAIRVIDETYRLYN